MISEGDKIAIGVSGGKDSLTLLMALSSLQNYYPLSFEICAISVDLGLPNMDFSPIRKLCEDLNVPYYVEETQISEIVFERREEKNPCALCSNLRKGALNDLAREIGCNKVAYAHHKDDVIETMMLSLLYEGRFHSFAPVTELSESDITLIRPLIYVSEAEVKGFAKRYELPVMVNTCPVDGATKREEVHNIVSDLTRNIPDVKKRLFKSVTSSSIEGWYGDKIARY